MFDPKVDPGGIPPEALRLNIPERQLELCQSLPKLPETVGSEEKMLGLLDSWVTIHENCAGSKKVLVETLRAANVKPAK